MLEHSNNFTTATVVVTVVSYNGSSFFLFFFPTLQSYTCSIPYFSLTSLKLSNVFLIKISTGSAAITEHKVILFYCLVETLYLLFKLGFFNLFNVIVCFILTIYQQYKFFHFSNIWCSTNCDHCQCILLSLQFKWQLCIILFFVCCINAFIQLHWYVF